MWQGHLARVAVEQLHLIVDAIDQLADLCFIRCKED